MYEYDMYEYDMYVSVSVSMHVFMDPMSHMQASLSFPSSPRNFFS